MVKIIMLSSGMALIGKFEENDFKDSLRIIISPRGGVGMTPILSPINNEAKDFKADKLDIMMVLDVKGEAVTDYENTLVSLRSNLILDRSQKMQE